MAERRDVVPRPRTPDLGNASVGKWQPSATCGRKPYGAAAVAFSAGAGEGCHVRKTDPVEKGDKTKNGTDLRMLVESAVAIALAVVLHMVTLWKLPQGGKVTSGSMVPLLIIAVRWGPKAGLGAGVLFGLVDYLLEPYFYHPVQFLLDYPIAFGCLGLAGFLPRWPLLGTTAGLAGRFLSHLLSGVVFFASYAPEGMSPWLYSAIYNATYLGPELVISLIVVGLVWWRIPGLGRTGHDAGKRRARA